MKSAPARVRIRSMRREDLDAVMTIEDASFPTPWSRQSYEGELDNPMAHYVTAECEGMVVGYGGVWFIVDEGHITNVAVHPMWRGRRIGEKLLRALEAIVQARGGKRITLEVRPSNVAALRLYRRLHYLPLGLRRGYYTDTGEDALVMARDLLPRSEV
ncbi:MAG: ribosomal protein S18-alanine N-acetyltransferase [Syntrophomonadaceae bacterium]|jgi:ribosomal-protein-alanine N-acetyltransferase|nr:ribosomal protein S18-alanine N-acetyltransferase [Syntrophomonadaceae bacterium]MDH7497182.1 ribosomal protein S18-alanine N-acetyltransferase [Syntrophomonadaceae bacterium]